MRLIGPIYSEKLGLPQYLGGGGRFLNEDIRLVIEDFTRLRRRYTGRASEEVDVITLPGELYDVTDENWGIREGEVRIKEYIHTNFHLATLIMVSDGYHEIFSNCFEGIIKLCEETIDHIEEEGLGLKVRWADLNRQ